MKLREILSISALGLLLAACGGGSDSSGAAGGGTGGGGTGGGSGGGTGGGAGGGSGGGSPVFGIDAGGLAYGVITSFGSVVVNGVRYDTTSAEILVAGVPASESDLRVGDVVELEGELDEDGVNGTALSIRTDSVVEGPVESIDLEAGVLVVLGQTIDVSTTTSFDDEFVPRTLEGVAVGMRVEVDGLISADGRIQATRIERDEDDSDFEVRGLVADLDPVASTFRINELRVDYSAAQREDFPAAGLSDGDLVEAEGDVFQNGVLQADEVDFEGNFLRRFCSDDDDDCGVEVEGYISRFASAADFDVGGVRVVTDADTVYEDGTAADLALDRKVEVFGVVAADGTLTALKIEFDDDDSPIEIKASVSEVDGANSVITLLGIRVRLDAQASLEDFSSAMAFPFRPEDIQVGDRLYIAARPIDSAVADVLATRVEREDDDDSGVDLTAFVSGIAAPSFTMLGVTVQTDADTEFQGRSGDVTSAQFFGELQIDDLVEVEGAQLAETVIAAEEVEIENDEGDDDD